MSDLIRYTETFSGMEPDDIGDWVTFDDAKALQEEVVRLYKEVGKAKSDLLINAADNNDTISALTQRLAEVEKGHVMAPVELVQELAYIGTDVGYAPFEPDPKHIHKAREIVALYKQALSNEEVTDEAISKT